MGNARKCYPKFSLLSLMLVATVITITLGLTHERIRIEIEQWRSRSAISAFNFGGGPGFDFEATDLLDCGIEFKIDDQVSDLDEVVVSNDEH